MTMALIVNGSIEQVGVPTEMRGTDISKLKSQGWVEVVGAQAPTGPVDSGYCHSFGEPYDYVDGHVTGTWTVQMLAQPHSSWTWVDGSGWIAPVPYPTDGKDYDWNEANGVWMVSEMKL